jgi:hypothetical protein
MGELVVRLLSHCVKGSRCGLFSLVVEHRFESRRLLVHARFALLLSLPVLETIIFFMFTTYLQKCNKSSWSGYAALTGKTRVRIPAWEILFLLVDDSSEIW